MGNDGWGLEVIRGTDVGKLFPLAGGATVLGNALGGDPGIDLGPQEGSSPRRMAARQARIVVEPDGLSIEDLESPGGTFVNRQRILPGQSRRLQAGDVVQLGSVQVRVVDRKGGTAPMPSAPAPKAASPNRLGPLPTPFRLANGSTCRTWDDFLTVSAKSWSALREELTSGRLRTFLAAGGRPDLLPATSGTADERLDAWLGALPTTRPAEAAIEVNPAVLRVRAVAGGGTVRRPLVVTNVGYRLLRSTARVEPASASWLRVAPEFSSRPFLTAEQTEVPVEVTIPEEVARPLVAAVVVEGNGGSRRVEVRVEPPLKTEFEPQPAGQKGASAGLRLRERIAGLSPGPRTALAALAAVAVRAALLVGDRLVAGAPGAVSLGGASVEFGLLGATAAGLAAWRHGEARGLAPAAFAGWFGGVLLAALVVALCRSLEPSWVTAGSPLVALAFWAALGGLLGAGSTLAIGNRGKGMVQGDVVP
jgi:hypothetical protein